MHTSTAAIRLPPPQTVIAQIESLEDELKAMRRLLRASNAAAKAEEARKRRTALPLLKTARSGNGE
jgi:hypothetical protein